MVHQAIPGVVTKIKGDDAYGQLLTVSIPRNQQAPIESSDPNQSVYSALKSFETSIAKKYNGHRLVSTIACPSAGKEHQFGLTIHYVPNPNPPAGGADHADAVDGAPCT